MTKAQASGKVPYRAFAYVQFCNGQSLSSCWSGDVEFSFSFQTRGIQDIGAYVKMLFWTDAGNIIGLVPVNHPKGDGKYRFVTFIQDDYPNQWADEIEIMDNVWYRVQVTFKPQSNNGVVISLTEVGGAEKLQSVGSVPVNMLDAGNGAQIGAYSFDYGNLWPGDEVKMSIKDICVGDSVCSATS